MKLHPFDGTRWTLPAFARWLVPAGLLLISLATASPALALAIVRFEPSATLVDVGDTLLVDVVADLSEPIVAFGFDLDIAPALLTAAAAPVIGPLWIGVFAPDGDGLAGLTATSGIAGTGVLLATLQLTAVGPAGSAQLLGSITQGDLTEGFGLAGEGFDSVEFEPASIIVIPEASTISLLSVGLLLVGGVRRLRLADVASPRAAARVRLGEPSRGHLPRSRWG